MHTLDFYYESGLISEEFKGIIPENCNCGGKFLLNEGMTQLKCSNSICPYHMAQKMDSMFKQLKVKDIGPATCETIIIENELVHHTQVFELDVHDMPSRNQDYVKEKFHEEIHKVTNLPLAGIARLLRAPDMQTRCDEIFKGYNDIDTFYRDFRYSEDFISQRIGVSKGILTKRFTDNLTKYEHILRGLCNVFQVTKVANETLVICMTGDVLTATREDGSYYSSREVFLSELQAISAGVLNITNKTSMSAKVHYLITDTPNSNTRKNIRAEELDIDKITFADFQRMIHQFVKSKEEVQCQ